MNARPIKKVALVLVAVAAFSGCTGTGTPDRAAAVNTATQDSQNRSSGAVSRRNPKSRHQRDDRKAERTPVGAVTKTRISGPNLTSTRKRPVVELDGKRMDLSQHGSWQAGGTAKVR